MVSMLTTFPSAREALERAGVVGSIIERDQRTRTYEFSCHLPLSQPVHHSEDSRNCFQKMLNGILFESHPSGSYMQKRVFPSGKSNLN